MNDLALEHASFAPVDGGRSKSDHAQASAGVPIVCALEASELFLQLNLSCRPCIYGILNNRTSKWYVGKAEIGPKLRAQRHASDLLSSRGTCRRLLNSFLVHGQTPFVFVVLEYTPKNRAYMEVREEIWISRLQAFTNGYNLINTSRLSGDKCLAAEARRLRNQNRNKCKPRKRCPSRFKMSDAARRALSEKKKAWHADPFNKLMVEAAARSRAKAIGEHNKQLNKNTQWKLDRIQKGIEAKYNKRFPNIGYSGVVNLIADALRNGKSSKSISELLGINSKAVLNLIKKHGLDIHRRKICPKCGACFHPDPPQQIYCDEHKKV